MNAEKILAVLFASIDNIWDANISTWVEFIDGGIEALLSNLTTEEKFEVAYRLNTLHLKLGSRQWHRRFNLVKKIHELI